MKLFKARIVDIQEHGTIEEQLKKIKRKEYLLNLQSKKLEKDRIDYNIQKCKSFGYKPKEEITFFDKDLENWKNDVDNCIMELSKLYKKLIEEQKDIKYYATSSYKEWNHKKKYDFTKLMEEIYPK